MKHSTRFPRGETPQGATSSKLSRQAIEEARNLSTYLRIRGNVRDSSDNPRTHRAAWRLFREYFYSENPTPFGKEGRITSIFRQIKAGMERQVCPSGEQVAELLFWHSSQRSLLYTYDYATRKFSEDGRMEGLLSLLRRAKTEVSKTRDGDAERLTDDAGEITPGKITDYTFIMEGMNYHITECGREVLMPGDFMEMQTLVRAVDGRCGCALEKEFEAMHHAFLGECRKWRAEEKETSAFLGSHSYFAGVPLH